MDIDRIKEILEKDCRLSPGRPILAGVSGGPDSLCLLAALARLDYPVIAAHYNHHLRAAASQDVEQTRAAAEQLGVPFVGGEGQVHAFARREGYSVEQAARILRYRFLFEQARRVDAQAVAVGHTADDQVETVLMHFLRGTGLRGLRGMRACSLSEWDPSIPLLRPLLETWHSETVACCAEAGLQPAFDLSNLEMRYARNRVRSKLIPRLERYNPQIKEAVLRLSRAATGDYEIVEGAAQAAWEQARLEEGPGFEALSLPALRALSGGLLRNVLRVAVERLRPGLPDIDYAAIERAADFVEQPTRSLKMDLTNGLCLSQGAGELFLYEQGSPVAVSAWPQLLQGQAGELEVPGRLTLGGGWTLVAEWDTATGDRKPWQSAEPGLHAWLDAACLATPLQVRARRPGDRFDPLGMQGHSLKMSDYFINEKLPQLARARWPLVCSQERIVWVPGFRPSHACRVGAQSQQVVHLFLEQEK